MPVNVTLQELSTCSQFDLEQSSFCNNDFIEIRKEGPGGEFIGRYCGNDIPNNLTSANKLWIKFRSNEEIAATGFMAQYNSGKTNIFL